jgi:hypothetical protein
MGEMQVADQEVKRQALGAPPRDLSVYTAWRDTADPDNLDLISFYCRYGLPGQTNGFSTALSLGAVKDALDIDGVPREQWPEMTERLIRLHALFEQNRPRKDR